MPAILEGVGSEGVARSMTGGGFELGTREVSPAATPVRRFRDNDPWEENVMQSARKIAVAGSTGRVGRHVVEVLEARGHHVVPISRSSGVDVITGEEDEPIAADTSHHRNE
jgi:hypothetical protein